MFGTTNKRLSSLNWQKLGAWLCLIVATAGLYGYRLGSLPAGISSQAQVEVNQSASLHTIFNNPVYAPHKLLLWATSKLWPHNLWAARLPAVLIGLALLACLFYILQKWFGRTVGLLATLIAGFTPWMLLASRQAEPLIIFSLPLALGAILLALPKSAHKNLLFGLLVVAVACSLYVPGLIWLLLLALVYRRQGFAEIISGIKGAVKSLWICVGLVLAVPFAWSLATNWHTNKILLGLPAHLPTPLIFAKDIAWSLLALVWRTPYHDSWMLGRLPALNIALAILAGFGVYAMLRLARAKAKLILVYAAGAILLAALNSSLQFEIMLLPVVFIFIAAGIRYLYFEWHSVFPANPIPKLLALAAIIAISGLSVLYGIKASLVAWPNNSETKASYHATIKF